MFLVEFNSPPSLRPLGRIGQYPYPRLNSGDPDAGRLIKIGYQELEQGPAAQQLTLQESWWIQIGSIAWLKTVA